MLLRCLGAVMLQGITILRGVSVGRRGGRGQATRRRSSRGLEGEGPRAAKGETRGGRRRGVLG